MLALGEMYLGGELDGSITEGIAMIRQAAEEGDADAMYALGKMYIDGDSVPTDRDKGIMWLRHASDKGNMVATMALERLKTD